MTVRTWTNMAWPDDPYRTGQQLYRRPSPMLAAFALARAADACGLAPAATAVVYLPLHRTHTITVTDRTFAFGFRAAFADEEADAPVLAAVADLDLLQARRHAAVVAGHSLSADLAVLRDAAVRTPWRGLAAVEEAWVSRDTRRRGMAGMTDSATDLPGSPDLTEVARLAGLAVARGARTDHVCAEPAPSGEVLARSATERALVIALACARHLGRWTWGGGVLDVTQIMTAHAWDCFERDGHSGAADAGLPVRH